MIRRIVKLSILENEIAHYRSLFLKNRKAIRSFKGCQHVEMFHCISEPSIFFTYSHWDNEESLEEYRNSDLFRSIWTKVKPLFADKAEAWSLNLVDE